ncbi:hypothetical protein HBB16_13000 [Pseudonocardia sp. MCCB 268]|nr:hypothetical protein [Pseudonocardia cytotoxica]
MTVRRGRRRDTIQKPGGEPSVDHGRLDSRPRDDRPHRRADAKAGRPDRVALTGVLAVDREIQQLAARTGPSSCGVRCSSPSSSRSRRLDRGQAAQRGVDHGPQRRRGGAVDSVCSRLFNLGNTDPAGAERVDRALERAV